jgi:2-isopropylmalate synthase
VTAAGDDQVRLLIDAETPVVTIVGKTWLLHVKEVLQTTAEENLAMIEDTVRHLKSHGRFVVYDAEHSFDGYKDEPEYALATLEAAERGGADVIVLCDTNGGSIPNEVAEITRNVKAQLKKRSASTRTTTSVSASPTRWRPSRPAPITCRARSTASASAPATAT